MPASIHPTSDSARDLDRLIERSKRASGARLPAAFARQTSAKSERVPPLARLNHGGRGGEVRLKLYLSLVLLAGSNKEHPTHGRHTIVDVASVTWARILALPDPSHAGARRVADAQDSLAAQRLITVERRAGHAPKVTLLHASGSGDGFVEPGMPYIRVPLSLWSERWIWCLSGKELAVLVALIDLCYGKGRDGRGGPQALSGIERSRYGLSEDTWRLASASLADLGIVTTDLDVVRFDLESPRRRKTYDLHLEALDAPAPIDLTA